MSTLKQFFHATENDGCTNKQTLTDFQCHGLFEICLHLVLYGTLALQACRRREITQHQRRMESAENRAALVIKKLMQD